MHWSQLPRKTSTAAESASAVSESDLEQLLSAADEPVQNEIAEDEINALLNGAESAAEAAPDSVVADDPATASEEEVTVTDEELLAALGSQEQSLAQIDENDTEPADDSSPPMSDVQEMDVVASVDASDDMQAAFSEADQNADEEEEAAVKAITEIKTLIEEDDLTKLTRTVERARELIADVGSQVDALADGDAATASDGDQLALAASAEDRRLVDPLYERIGP